VIDMVGEFWFYGTTVLICTGYAFLLQSYPQWKVYLSIGFAAFVLLGGGLVYWDAQKKEDIQTKIGQLEHMVEVAKKEAAKQESLTRDATDRAHLLAEQLQAKSGELSRVLKDKPQIEGEIKKVRIFPWQRASARDGTADGTTTATGLLVFARIENEGSGTTLANWELSIELPDNTIIRAQKWPVGKAIRIPCDDGPIKISKDEYLDAKSREAVQRTEARSGVTIWMVKNVPLRTLQTKNSFYTLTARDNTGVVHALKKYSLPSSPQPCSGFEVVD
jgi:hypothetical protein